MHVSSPNGTRKEEQTEKTKEEIFFEAVDSLADLTVNPGSQRDNYKRDARDSINYIIKRGKKTVDAKNVDYCSPGKSTSEKAAQYSAFTTKNTNVTERPSKSSLKTLNVENLRALNNLGSFNNDWIKRLSQSGVGKQELEELQSQRINNLSSNVSSVSGKYSPIAMNINNKIKSSPKINVNFNININCEKEDKTSNSNSGIIKEKETNNSKSRNDKENTITLRNLELDETPYETIYETADLQIENESGYSSVIEVRPYTKVDKQYQNLSNFNSHNIEEENVSLKAAESVNISNNASDNNVELKRNITDIKFDMVNEIDLSFLRKNLKIIHVKNRQTSLENKNLRYVLELQNFQIDFQQIWIVKLSQDGRYLATGGKTGVLKIFEILTVNSDNYKSTYTNEDIFSYLNFINEKPVRVYNDHSNDIIDICWSPTKKNILLTASLDHLVIMWDLNYDCPLAKFDHSSIVTCICFYPYQDAEEDEKFVTGCLDKIIRIWSSKKNKVLDYINIKEYITSITYLPAGDMIAVGTHNGRCCIYDSKPKLRYNFSFTCRNRMGKYSQGRKITNIEFINRSQAVVTTNDSRIRLVNISDGKLVHKYKGHVNEQYMIRAFYNETSDLIISASEDGFVYIWNKSNKENDDKKNYSFEFFKPFYKDTASCSILVNDECAANYLKKVFNLTTRVMIHSIIINASVGGRLQVLINCDDMDKL